MEIAVTFYKIISRYNYTSLLKISVTIIFITTSFLSNAQIEGKWTNKETGDVLEIYKANNLFFAKAIATKNEAENKKLQSGTLIILSNFKKENENKYCCGKIYLPRRKITADGTIKLVNANTIKVKGSYGFLSYSIIWTRI